MSVLSASATVAIGVGFDTARYGHHVTFLLPDLQPACPPREVAESQQGYQLVLQQFQVLQQRHRDVHFHIRLDAAGQYAANLEAFLRALPFPKTITVGDPARNDNYRKAIFPKRKADPTESYCAARFALVEQPRETPSTPAAFQSLREIVQRLEGQTRQSTRLTNQLHNVLARVFPELATFVTDLQAAWVLQMLNQYPTPAQLARCRLASLTAIPHLSEDKAQPIRQAAAVSVASFTGDAAAALVQQLVAQLRQSAAICSQLKEFMTAAYEQLPIPNHLDSIPGIGAATAAVLTAKIVALDRFATPNHLVGYFGLFPEKESSGVDKDGKAKIGRPAPMSRKGNDLVRKYLWNAALTAIVHNPAVKALYRRLRSRGARGDVAMGHCMRKLLHLAFAVWKTGKPFDPKHYPWQTPAEEVDSGNEKTAGHKPSVNSASKVVSAATPSVNPHDLANKTASAKSDDPAAPTAAGSIDFAALRAQINMEQVLAHLGCLTNLKGSGPQRRGPCPLHGARDPRQRTFSVHLGKKVFQCFYAPCGAHGNVLDLWAAIHRLPLYEAAKHLAQTFALSLPTPGSEKRNT
jgi:transposase